MRFPAIGLLVMSLLSWGCDRTPAHFKPQRITLDRMSFLLPPLTDFRERNGRPPLSLEELRTCYEFKPEAFVDGWGRPLWYYVASSTYVLASFGADGRPGTQRSVGWKYFAEEDDPNLDFVFVNGEWAQFPRSAGDVATTGQSHIVPKRPICP